MGMLKGNITLPFSVKGSIIIYRNVCLEEGNMKVLALPIEMVAWTDLNGKLNPVRFKIANGDESISVIKIDKVIIIDKERLAGNNMLVYNCQSTIKGSERIYQLKYSFDTCKWMLWKL